MGVSYRGLAVAATIVDHSEIRHSATTSVWQRLRQRKILEVAKRTQNQLKHIGGRCGEAWKANAFPAWQTLSRIGAAEVPGIIGPHRGALGCAERQPDRISCAEIFSKATIFHSSNFSSTFFSLVAVSRGVCRNV
jgi:hypothetical protein